MYICLTVLLFVMGIVTGRLTALVQLSCKRAAAKNKKSPQLPSAKERQ